jgi:hypothetical protein
VPLIVVGGEGLVGLRGKVLAGVLRCHGGMHNA